jgi:hypothetical protein
MAGLFADADLSRASRAVTAFDNIAIIWMVSWKSRRSASSLENWRRYIVYKLSDKFGNYAIIVFLIVLDFGMSFTVH